MYAIVEIAGKHYKVEDGAEITVDLLHKEQGEKVEFDKITMLRDDKNIQVGTPYIKDSVVQADVIEPNVKGKKLTVMKYMHKTNRRKKNGHRQQYTKIKISGISNSKKKDTAEA